MAMKRSGSPTTSGARIGRLLVGFCVLATAGVVAVPTASASPACDRAGKDAMFRMLARRESLRISQAASKPGQSIDQFTPSLNDKFKAEDRQIEMGYETNCLPGDTVSIPSANPAQVARYCDTGKSIADNGNVTTCVMRAGVASAP